MPDRGPDEPFQKNHAYKLALMWVAESLRDEAAKWKALGDPARWRIFCVLATGPRSVMSLCEELDTYQSQVSGHLAVLRRAGLVAATRSGYFNVYRVDSRTLDLLFERLRDLSRRSS
jgi:ArsR family transcriptional regulator, arsenate/arsenite/antimonite-responsive transcriptional repressor